MPHLRDGTEADDPRLGRLPDFDPRSRQYPVRAVIGVPQPRSYTWRYTRRPLDQGQVGACVAYMIGGQAAARPAELPDEQFARMDRDWLLGVYCDAQRIDPWPGTDRVCSPAQSPFYGGTSILAGLKTAVDRGLFREYRWAFGVDDAVLGVGRNGPGLLGTWWRAGMMRPDSSGRITYSGSYVGGHAYLAVAVDVSGVDDWLDGDVRLLNSWGPGWGDGGWATMSIRSLAAALEERGECAFAQRRTFTPHGLAG